MVLDLLLIGFSGLMSLIAMALTTVGLMRRKRRFWKGSFVAFVCFVLFNVFSVYSYLNNSNDHRGFDGFQGKRKTKDAGRILGNAASGATRDVQATLDDEAIIQLAKKGAKIVGNGMKAMTTVFGGPVGKTLMFTDESVAQAGIVIGRAERIAKTDTTSVFGLFLEFKKDFKGTLTLTAYDSNGLKRDTSEIALTGKAGKEEIQVFAFNYFHPHLSGYCVLSGAE
ncbi:MAG TPA: hypothetical protein VL728_05585 [Cyclobacteriaceae bacterium]|nr:hypothetical protein [Cyclobacteriaceae bacterium]